MKEKQTAADLINLLAQRSGITRKLAGEFIRAIPEVIEQGLISDGEVKVRNLGTFRMKKVAEKKGRNPKTGESVIIPPHEKLVFLPEESFKEQMNEEFRYFNVIILDEEPVGSQQSAVSSQRSAVSDQQPVATTQEEVTALNDTREPEIQNSETQNSESETQNSELITQNSSPPIVKRRNKWIIPVAIGLVVVLSVVFYFRNFRQSQQSAVNSQQSEQVQEQPVATTMEKSTMSDTEAVVSREPSAASRDSGTMVSGTSDTIGTDNQGQTAVSGQQSVVTKSEPELKPQNSNLNTPLPTTTVETHLFQLAREVYGNPFMWVLIYRANQDKIKDPDIAVSGENIVIPALEGTAKNLTYNDSLAVSDGYRLVYEYYRDKGDPRAEEFRLVMLKYQPK